MTEYEQLVEDLAVEHRRKSARRQLMQAGFAATPAIRRGLNHSDPSVRSGCCQVLDHFLDEAALPELMLNLDHDDDKVRAWALHALACDRCKEGECRPGEDDVVPITIRMLLTDPSRTVRYQAVHLLGQAVHRRTEAVEALQRARTHDTDPLIRKVAGWYVPGGPRFERTAPRPARVLKDARV